ncbi:MAG: hypothetical protein OEV92_05150 [Nitrospinota bacterium]|nr:hypothetical protein [Nitrospinota bacterium]
MLDNFSGNSFPTPFGAATQLIEMGDQDHQFVFGEWFRLWGYVGIINDYGQGTNRKHSADDNASDRRISGRNNDLKTNGSQKNGGASGDKMPVAQNIPETSYFVVVFAEKSIPR